jgi:hypothetical protein
VGGDRVGRVLQLGRGERRTPPETHLQLLGRETVPVAAVDGRLARVQRRHVRALLLGEADQLLLGGRRGDLGEPDGVVGGQVALRVGRTGDPDPVVGHGLSHP